MFDISCTPVCPLCRRTLYSPNSAITIRPEDKLGGYNVSFCCIFAKRTSVSEARDLVKRLWVQAQQGGVEQAEATLTASYKAAAKIIRDEGAALTAHLSEGEPALECLQEWSEPEGEFKAVPARVNGEVPY